MIFKKRIAKTEIETVTITEFVNEFCRQFGDKRYISVEVLKDGSVHLFLGRLIEQEDE